MKVNQNVLRFFLGYLGGELNQACVRNGTGAESESFLFYFCENHKNEGQAQHKILVFRNNFTYILQITKLEMKKGKRGGDPHLG